MDPIRRIPRTRREPTEVERLRRENQSLAEDNEALADELERTKRHLRIAKSELFHIDQRNRKAILRRRPRV